MNHVRTLRLSRFMTQRDLARKANVALRTVVHIEQGRGCHMHTKRRILRALGLSMEDRGAVFPEGPAETGEGA